ncbi:MAG: hypothetical protein JJ899_10980 [Alphaproteobacteria bacterium]|nr:hypothetical protein [Alphaproteobacteria bacterium]
MIFLFLSIVDVLVYATVLSVVVETVFALGGADRFIPTLVGLVALRWSLSCAIQASRTTHLAHIYRSRRIDPLLATVVLAIAGPTFIFLVSISLLVPALVLTVREPALLTHMLGWGVVVAVVQFIWNIVLVLTIVHMRLRQVLLSELPIVFGFMLLLIVSPVAYQFGDIPVGASRMLTSLNPFAHLIAGYQNAFWFIRAPSLEVLPWAALAGVFLIAVLGPLGRALCVLRTENEEAPAALLKWTGESWSLVETPPTVRDSFKFSRWQGELPWITGASFLYLIEKSSSARERRAEMFGALAGGGDGRRVLASALPLMSHSNRDRLCVVSALAVSEVGESQFDNVIALGEGASGAKVLDGLMDHAEADELDALTRILTEQGIRSLYLVTQRRRVAGILLDSEQRRGVTN